MVEALGFPAGDHSGWDGGASLRQNPEHDWGRGRCDDRDSGPGDHFQSGNRISNLQVATTKGPEETPSIEPVDGLLRRTVCVSCRGELLSSQGIWIIWNKGNTIW
jgi:hypothetical protein